MREIITEKSFKAGLAKVSAADQTDGYVDKIIKLIPGEVVALYITLAGILAAGGMSSSTMIWVIFFVCLIGTPLYLNRISHVGNTVQIGISTVAYIVWVFALGGPFATLSWYLPIYGALLLPIFTFFAPMVFEK